MGCSRTSMGRFSGWGNLAYEKQIGQPTRGPSEAMARVDNDPGSVEPLCTRRGAQQPGRRASIARFNI
jgi:hypothetical protein